MEALKLTLSMLKNKSMDFLRLNGEAGITRIPKVHAVVMTHCGWNRQAEYTPDRSTQSYLVQVVEITAEYKDLFTSSDPIDCIHLLDDFHSAGRIQRDEAHPARQVDPGAVPHHRRPAIAGEQVDLAVSKGGEIPSIHDLLDAPRRCAPSAQPAPAAPA